MALTNWASVCIYGDLLCQRFFVRVGAWGKEVIIVISMPDPPIRSALVPDPTLIHTKYLHQTSPWTYTVLHIRHPSSLPPSFPMLYLLLVSSLSIVYLWPFIVTMLSHMSSFATIPPPYAFSILHLYPHALHTFPYAPPYLHLIPDLNIIVYKSSVLRLCTSVHISTKSPILLLKVPLCVSAHLHTSAPPYLKQPNKPVYRALGNPTRGKVTGQKWLSRLT